MPNPNRCAWVTKDPYYIDYHDHEWGIPLHDDQQLFELLILEGMQAGLSWLTILKKRAHFRDAFDQFDATRIVRYDQRQVKRLLNNANIIRHPLKINAVIANAKAYLDIKATATNPKHGFNDYIWQFVDGKPIQNHWKTISDIPAETPESIQLSKALKQRGFKFVGPKICYAFMQAAGLVNDHTTDCDFR